MACVRCGARLPGDRGRLGAARRRRRGSAASATVDKLDIYFWLARPSADPVDRVPALRAGARRGLHGRRRARMQGSSPTSTVQELARDQGLRGGADGGRQVRRGGPHDPRIGGQDRLQAAGAGAARLSAEQGREQRCAVMLGQGGTAVARADAEARRLPGDLAVALLRVEAGSRRRVAPRGDYHDLPRSGCSGPSSWTVRYSTRSSTELRARRAPARVRGGAADACARLRAGAAAPPRGAARASSSARSSCLAARGRRRARRRRGGGVVPRRRARRAAPGRGVRWGSGLEPPPHLVGERARALDVLGARRARLRVGGRARRGDAAAGRAAGADPRSRVGDEPGIDALAEQLALAGYERVERVEERGQFAVRGGLVDVFPTTGREPLRIELFGDEIEAVRAFSPFTQRALHPVDERRRLPGRRAAARPRRARRCPDDEGERARRCPDDLVPALDRAPDLVWRAGRGARRSGTRRSSSRVDARRRDASSTRFPRGQPFAFEAQRPAIAARGLAEAENELARARPRRPPRRRRVPAPRRGAPHAEPAAAGRGARARGRRRAAADERAPLRGRARAPRLRLARPRPRPPARHAGLPQARAARRRARSAARCSRSPTCAPATTSSTRTTASASCSASRRRRSPASRATTSSSRSAARTASTSRTSRSARSRATSAPTRRRPRSRSSAARRGRCSRAARASRVRELAGELLALYAQRAARAGRRLRPLEHDWLERLEAEFPYRETRGPGSARSRR